VIDFPNTPAIGQSFTPLTGRGYFWDGVSWNALARRMPSPWAFVDVTNAVTNTLYVSNTVTVAQLAAAAPVSVTGGSYSRNGGAATTATGMVVNGDTIAVNVASALTLNAAVDAVLRIGGAADIFTVTTATTVDPNRSKIRVSQLLMEPVYKTPSKIRASQILMEPVYKTPSKVRLSQILMEVVRSIGGTAVATTTLDLSTAPTTVYVYNDRLWLANVITQNGVNVKATAGHTTGKWVFVARLRQHDSTNGAAIGLAPPALGSASQIGTVANSAAVWLDGTVYVNATTFASSIAANAALNFSGGGEVMVATDFDAKLVWFRVGSGNWNNNASANPATGVGGVSISGIAIPVVPAFALGASLATAQDIMAVNFGQFAFANAAPAGFAAWG
jgi:hypothetical protein